MTSNVLLNKVVLQNRNHNGELLQAIFLPEHGMNLCSYQVGGVEVIEQSTWPLFEERGAGLGALIGPHFHHRKPEAITPIVDETIFPHIERVRLKGVKEPFSHGIARYVPWKFEANQTGITAELSGTDRYKGVLLSSLEGQQFHLKYHAELTADGLKINYSVESSSKSVIGLHYYYALNNPNAFLKSRVQPLFFDQDRQFKPLPQIWNVDSEKNLSFELSQGADFGFTPFPDPSSTEISVQMESYRLIIAYSCSKENSWQLYHPKETQYVCIEPLTAKDPFNPQLTSSSIQALIKIEKTSV